MDEVNPVETKQNVTAADALDIEAVVNSWLAGLEDLSAPALHDALVEYLDQAPECVRSLVEYAYAQGLVAGREQMTGYCAPQLLRAG